MHHQKCVVIALCSLALAAVHAGPTQPQSEAQGRSAINEETGGYRTCLEKLDVSCMKFNLAKNLDKVIHQRSFQLLENVQLEQIPGTERLTSSRALTESELETILPKEQHKRDEKLDEILMDKVSTLLKSRSLSVGLDSVYPGAALKVGRAKDDDQNAFTFSLQLPQNVGEARTRGGMRRWLPILGFFGMNVFTLGFLSLMFIKFLAASALMVGKLALVLSSIIGLRKLFSGHGVTYEVVSHPHYSYHDYTSGTHEHEHAAGYQRRSLQVEAAKQQQMAYRGHHRGNRGPSS